MYQGIARQTSPVPVLVPILVAALVTARGRRTTGTGQRHLRRAQSDSVRNVQAVTGTSLSARAPMDMSIYMVMGVGMDMGANMGMGKAMGTTMRSRMDMDTCKRTDGRMSTSTAERTPTPSPGLGLSSLPVRRLWRPGQRESMRRQARPRISSSSSNRTCCTYRAHSNRMFTRNHTARSGSPQPTHTTWALMRTQAHTKDGHPLIHNRHRYRHRHRTHTCTNILRCGRQHRQAASPPIDLRECRQ